jgi:diaminopimelate decarboxylase
MIRKIPNEQQAKKFIEKYGSPVNVCYEETVLSNINKFKTAFKKYPGGFQLYYSVKTNPIIGILKILKNNGVDAEICSHSDFAAAVAAGFKGERMIYDGLVKSDQDLERAILENIKIINIESVDEARRLALLAKKYKKIIDVGIRLAFPSSRVALKSILGISYERFGVSLENGEADVVLKIILESKYLNLVGLHCHTGSNQKTYGRYLIGIDHMIAFAKKIKTDHNISIKVFNLGGGFGLNEITAYKVTDFAVSSIKGFLRIPASFANSAIDFQSISSKIISHLTKCLERENLEFPFLMLEPGRSLIGNSIHLICRVINVKDTGKIRWIIIDAGTNLMPILTIYSEFHEIILFSKKKLVKTSIAGPLLYSSDIIVSNRLFPKADIGDVAVIADVGAYFTCQANQFLFPRIPTVLISKNEEQIIQRRESIRDMLIRDIA